MNYEQIAGIGLLLVSVWIAAVSQILLKQSANRSYLTKIQEYLNPLVIGGYALLLCTTLINVFAMRWVPLSLSSALDASGQVFVPLLSFVVLKEPISRRKLRGMAIIVAGILIFFA